MDSSFWFNALSVSGIGLYAVSLLLRVHVTGDFGSAPEGSTLRSVPLPLLEVRRVDLSTHLFLLIARDVLATGTMAFVGGAAQRRSSASRR
jgi:hypothetical protein